MGRKDKREAAPGKMMEQKYGVADSRKSVSLIHEMPDSAVPEFLPGIERFWPGCI